MVGTLSVRKALVLVAVVATVPALAIIVAAGVWHTAHLEQSVIAEAHRSVESIVSIQSQTIGSIEQLLRTLERLQPLRMQRHGETEQILRDVLEGNPDIVNITVTDTEGMVVASPGIERGTDLSNRRHIQEALRTDRFVAGEYVMAFVGREPSLPFAHPVHGPDGSIVGVVTAVFPLSNYEGLFDRLNLPPDTVLGITDHHGVRLFFHPEKETNPIGGRMKNDVWEAMSTGEAVGIVVSEGSDGIRRHYAYQRVFLDDDRDQPYLYVAVGFPVDVSRGVAQRFLARNLALMILVIVVAILVAHGLGGAVFARQMEQLAATARRISSGELGARTGVSERRTEIGAVAQAIDEMAERLEERVNHHVQEQTRISISLQEKEILLQEIHHRVKNNMQLIMSIVRLQRGQSLSTHEFAAMIEARIGAIASVHELLYRSEDLASVNMGTLLQNLARIAAFSSTTQTIEVEAEPIELPMEQAMPLALISNELAINALKHGAAGGAATTLTFVRKAEHLILSVCDGGPGFPETFNVERSDGLGMKLVRALVEQLHGTLEISRREPNGACVTVRSPAPASAGTA
ncbi:MAG: sensor histidine kinase [Spirochaetota bacterium]